ncbi:unnamed protein product [Durusdinium trenchii]|uniref:Uncharacterized protein n=1 Tax=Durusdinium trenchii TaxID=1381693 RepID=A0ABP0MCX3_9DINO
MAGALVGALPFPVSELTWEKLPAVVEAGKLSFENAVMVMKLVLGEPPEEIDMKALERQCPGGQQAAAKSKAKAKPKAKPKASGKAKAKGKSQPKVKAKAKAAGGKARAKAKSGASKKVEIVMKRPAAAPGRVRRPPVKEPEQPDLVLELEQKRKNEEEAPAADAFEIPSCLTLQQGLEHVEQQHSQPAQPTIEVDSASQASTLQLGASVSTVPATAAELEMRAQLATLQAELDVLQKKGQSAADDPQQPLRRIPPSLALDTPIFGSPDNQMGLEESQFADTKVPASSLDEPAAMEPAPAVSHAAPSTTPAPAMCPLMVAVPEEAGTAMDQSKVAPSPEEAAVAMEKPAEPTAPIGSSQVPPAAIEPPSNLAPAAPIKPPSHVVPAAPIEPTSKVEPSPQEMAAGAMALVVAPATAAMAPSPAEPPAMPKEPANALTISKGAMPVESVPPAHIPDQPQVDERDHAIATLQAKLKVLEDQLLSNAKASNAKAPQVSSLNVVTAPPADLPDHAMVELDGEPLNPVELDEEMQRLINENSGPGSTWKDDVVDNEEQEEKINYSTHRNSGMRLNRFMESKEGAKFPHMRAMFESDRTALLRVWVLNKENRNQCESEVILSRSKSARIEGIRECITVKEMIKRGWPKGKILGAIQKGGGIKDEHDPTDPTLTSYWCITGRKKVDSEEMKQESTMRVKTESNAESLDALLGSTPALPPSLGLSAAASGMSDEQVKALADALGSGLKKELGQMTVATDLPKDHALRKVLPEIAWKCNAGQSWNHCLMSAASTLRRGGAAWHFPWRYLYDDNGINITLQAAAQWIAESINRLSVDGVRLKDPTTGEEAGHFYGYAVHFKGDWKYLVALFNMTQSAQQEQVCWKCGASKGTSDPNMCYVNLNHDAPWRRTAVSMWSVKPAFANIVGFSKEMVAPDVLHCWHLGVCRDLIGSVVRLLVSERYWPGSNINDRLAFATASLKRWAKHRALSLTIKRLTKQNLSWGDQYFG